MFTGLIESTARITEFESSAKKAVLTLKHALRGKINLGDSIAVDGCCLTVVSNRRGLLTFELSDETLRLTKASTYRIGASVNIERAMRATARLGGHFVLGHVDGVGKVVGLKRSAGSLRVEIQAPQGFGRYLIQKGSVTIDGVSLTVSPKGRDRFCVYIIPHTEKLTTISSYERGTLVNLEADVLGKYVERLMARRNK